MHAGKLRHRATLYKPVETQNTYGEPEVRWQTVDTVWVQIEPLRGREYFASKQTVSEVEVRCTIRYRDDVTAKMKIVHGTEEYQILSVIDVGGRYREMQLMCKRLET